MRLPRLLWLLIVLSIVPALVLAVRRGQSEGRSRTVAIVMDEVALAEQARVLGISSFELARRYQELGLPGVAIYEDTIETLAATGRIASLLGSNARSLAAANGEVPPAIPADSTLVTELEAGALERLLAKNRPTAQAVTLAGRTWFLYPGNGLATRPAGPDLAKIQTFAEAGFDIAYRPRNIPNLAAVGSDFPEAARYLIHAGLVVSGYPNSLDDLAIASQGYLTATIEGTSQDGMGDLARRVPTVRLLSFNQDFINRRLRPQDLIDKFLLGANERGIRLLYLRPYTEEQQGDMFTNTEALIAGLVVALERDGFRIAPLTTLELDYSSVLWLRSLSAMGILAALVLLMLMYPGGWGVAVAVAVAALGLAAGGVDWDALALVAALVFPVIGYGHLKERLVGLGTATLISLAGATLLAAVGSDRASMLGISPFAGVAATLVVPPALFLFHYALRYRGPAGWLRSVWGHRVRVGDVLVVVFGIAALGLVFVRRGNFPVIGASSAELALRDWLADVFVRPRFKELMGHPLAVLALANRGWPAWIKGLLLTGGVVAQASILNSFSHYHTPLIISLQRSLVALVLGVILGLVLVPIARGAIALVRTWLRTDDDAAAGT